MLDSTRARVYNEINLSTTHQNKEGKNMQYGLFTRSYKGMYFVEYSTKSTGMTLLATWDKEQAEQELKRLQSMSAKQLKEYLLSR